MIETHGRRTGGGVWFSCLFCTKSLPCWRDAQKSGVHILAFSGAQVALEAAIAS